MMKRKTLASIIRDINNEKTDVSAPVSVCTYSTAYQSTVIWIFWAVLYIEAGTDGVKSEREREISFAVRNWNVVKPQ